MRQSLFFFGFFLLAACISGPPRELQDDEVMWLEFKETLPSAARDLLLTSIEKQRFICRKDQLRGQFSYGCGQGRSYNDTRQLKGACQRSPTDPINSVCDVFFVSITPNKISEKYAQPDELRTPIEMTLLRATGAERIQRPVPWNNLFSVDRTIPRYSN